MGLRYRTTNNIPLTRCSDGTLTAYEFAAGIVEPVFTREGKRAKIWYDPQSGDYIVENDSAWEWTTPNKREAYKAAREVAKA